MKEYPCERCGKPQRVKDACTSCEEWRAWFAERWKIVCERFRPRKEQDGKE